MQHSLAKGHAHSFLIFSKCDKPLNIEGCRFVKHLGHDRKQFFV